MTFERWLSGRFSLNIAGSRTSDIRQLERHYGPLQEIWMAGQADTLLAELSITTSDVCNDRHNPSKLNERRDFHADLATLKQSAKLYFEYCAALFEGTTAQPATTDRPITTSGTRKYRGYALGNLQNGLVRYLLTHASITPFSRADWDAVVEKFNGECAYCGAPGPLVMDHIVPVDRVSCGEHVLGNVVPACTSCKLRKAAHPIGPEFVVPDHRRSAIEAHMEEHGYSPDLSYERREIIAQAYEDVGNLAEQLRERLSNTA